MIKTFRYAACLCLISAWSAAVSAADNSFVRTIFLVRHGTYVPDPKDNDPGPGLTPLGLAQSRLAGARFAAMPIRFESIVSSTLTRAQQTAVEIRGMLPNVPGSANALLSECTPVSATSPQPPPADQVACKQRLDMAFEKLVVPATESDKNNIFVCHGNVIRYFAAKAMGLNANAWTDLAVANASLTIVRVRADGTKQVMAINDSGHIPPNLLSYGGAGDPQLTSPGLGVFSGK